METLSGATDVKQLWQNALGFLTQALQADRGVILHDELWDGEYAVADVWGVHPDEVWSGAALDLVLVRSVCKKKAPEIRTPNNQEHTALCVPILNEGRVLGLLYAHRLQAGRPFSPQDLERAFAYAQQIAPVLLRLAPPPAAPVEESFEPVAMEVPKVVGGRFAVLGQVMLGRFSTLYEAEDKATGTPLRLRRLDPEGASREARLQTLREGRLLARLQHRNLPRVMEVIEDRTGIYLVLEEFSGRTLEEVVKTTGPVPPELIHRYLEQFLSVLDYLHGQDPPIVHRDLRPQTVLVTQHGVLKIVEFGLARMRESTSDKSGTAFRSQGSPNFAAPEQLLGEPSHPGNDLYAVASILYYLATGQEPPRSVDRLFGAVDVPRLEQLGPQMAQLVAWLHDPELSRRPSTVAEVYQALAAATAQQAPASEPAPAAPVAHAPPGASEAVEKPKKKKKAGFFDMISGKLGTWQILLHQKKEAGVRATPHESGIFHPPDAPTVDLSQVALDPAIARLLTETVSRSIQGVCIGRPTPEEIVVAVKDPSQIHIYDHISLASHGQFRPQLLRADPLMVDLAIEYCYKYPGGQGWGEWLERKKLETESLEVANPMSDVAFGLEDITSPIVEAVDRLIKEAISAGASDIHLETYEKGSELRYRVDGVLHPINSFPTREASAMVKRLKVMANMDIAQERIPQGGRISLKVAGQELDLRVSIVPVPAGESVVMRLLKKGAFNLTLADLGFAPHTGAGYEKILAQPYGMILVCGPTGSGKSTTLYASLKQIQRPDRKLLTVEDPIEYQMPGICQVQVNTAPREEEKKVTFARVLREFLRQDPDVILVGEIRDPETAQIAVQAALTGHLLLSTIHTNDSVGIIARLRDMGIESFLIGSTLLGGVAQRLARRICAECRVEDPITPEVADMLAREGFPNARLYKGAGCKKCHGTGHRGRLGLYELLEITPEVRALVNRAAPEEEIRKVAMTQGYRPLYYDGLLKVAEGKVTLEEVQRVCKTI